MSHDRVRLVWLLQVRNILVGQLNLESLYGGPVSTRNSRKEQLVITDHLLEVFQLCSANDGGSDLLRAPSKCDLGHLDFLPVGEFLDTRVGTR